MVTREHFEAHLSALRQGFSELDLSEIERIVDVLRDARRTGRQVFVFGNGGSAATASHMACDLSKTASSPGQPRLKTIALTDNVPLITAIGNDLTYDDIFVEQMATMWSEGDVALAISASGNSPNVLKATRYATAHGGETIAFTGFGGGQLAALASLKVVLSSDDYGVVEDLHGVLNHMITRALRRPEGTSL